MFPPRYNHQAMQTQVAGFRTGAHAYTRHRNGKPKAGAIARVAGREAGRQATQGKPISAAARFFG